MRRQILARAGGWILVLTASALLATGCGSGRKKYLAQVMPLIEQNDAIDARVAQLPKVNAFKHPDYLPKLDGYIASKQDILNQLNAMEPPFLMATTHARLLQAMENGIRYLQSEREKFIVAAERMAQMPPSEGTMEDELIREYQSQTSAYLVDMREQLMKQQYEKLYGEVKDELERAKKF